MEKCKYCNEGERQQLKKITVKYSFEDPKAVCYPDIAFWGRSYELNFCPMCKRIIKDCLE